MFANGKSLNNLHLLNDIVAYCSATKMSRKLHKNDTGQQYTVGRREAAGAKASSVSWQIETCARYKTVSVR